MKKALLLLVLSVVLGGTVFAQEKAEEAHKNAVYLGTADIFGFAIGYERMLRPNFSLVFESGASAFITQAAYITLRGRWFPFSDSNVGLFVSCGLGYGQLAKEASYFIWERDDDYEIYGGLISPGVGMKVGFGKPRGFVLTAAIDYDIILGEKAYFNYDIGRGKYEGDGEFGVGLNLNAKVLFGFAF